MSHDGKELKGTQPQKASAFRKGHYIMLKGNPCKIVDMSTSKTGKHGHAKVKFTGVDIFTGKKYQELQGSTHSMQEVLVSKTEYAVIDIDDSAQDGTAIMSTLTAESNPGPEVELDLEENEVHQNLFKAFKSLDDDKELMAIVTEAIDKLALQEFKLQNVD